MDLAEALRGLGEGNRSESLALFSRTLDIERVRRVLTATGTASVRKRKLPAEVVVWLVIGMALLRDRCIDEVVEHLHLVLPEIKEDPRSALRRSFGLGIGWGRVGTWGRWCLWDESPPTRNTTRPPAADHGASGDRRRPGRRACDLVRRGPAQGGDLAHDRRENCSTCGDSGGSAQAPPCRCWPALHRLPCYAARRLVDPARCRTRSCLLAPILKRARTSRSMLTDGSPASIFATRD